MWWKTVHRDPIQNTKCKVEEQGHTRYNIDGISHSAVPCRATSHLGHGDSCKACHNDVGSLNIFQPKLGAFG